MARWRGTARAASGIRWCPPRGGLYPTVARLLRDGHSTFVLTAPCPATARLLRPLFDDRRSASLEPPADAGFDRRGWLSLIARLINQGAQLDLAPERFAAGLARVRLPGYPFERRRHWLDDPGQPAAPPRPGPVSMADA